MTVLVNYISFIRTGWQPSLSSTRKAGPCYPLKGYLKHSSFLCHAKINRIS